MLSIDEARETILSVVQATGRETLSVADAAGRVLAETLLAKRNLPPCDNSAMDGYGLRAQDAAGASDERPVALELVGAQLAGGADVGAVPAGKAVRIMTGATIPAGIDAVVMRENTDESRVNDDATGSVAVRSAPRAGENIRRRGEDTAAGEVVGALGDVITPGRLNLLASAGHALVAVHRRPRVGILSSGDELRELGEPLAETDIVNSNAHAIAAAVREAGGVPELLGIARDSLPDHRDKIDAARSADVLITIGGVSVGTHDFVRPALEALGVTLDLWKVAMRPGKPLAFGRRDHQLVFGLPGNPVSSQVSFELFVRPALLRLQGRPDVVKRALKARVVSAGMRKKPGFTVFARARVSLGDDAQLVLELDGKQGSGQVSGLARANALCVLPAEGEGVATGELASVLLLDDSYLLA